MVDGGISFGIILSCAMKITSRILHLGRGKALGTAYFEKHDGTHASKVLFTGLGVNTSGLGPGHEPQDKQSRTILLLFLVNAEAAPPM